MKTIVKIIFGSHLYGTDTPDSDQDFKGIFLPTKEQIFLGKIPKSINENTKKGEGKNTADDVDTEIYSLHYFLKLACEGQTVSLDMLHAPDNMIIETKQIAVCLWLYSNFSNPEAYSFEQAELEVCYHLVLQ